MYILERLNHAFTAWIYQPLTFPQFRPLLQTLQPQSSTVAVAASDGNQPIGLVLATIQTHRRSCKVLSIFVESSYRCQGIGTALLTKLETEVRKYNCISIELIYTTSHPATAILERLLQNFNWSKPQPRMLVGKSTCSSISNAHWMKLTVFPAAYDLVPWQQVTPEERTMLQQKQQTNPWIPSLLIPFQHEQNLETLNSLGLRYRGEIVGWIITHRLNLDTIRYTSGFIRPDLKLRYISLIANAIQKQVNAKIPYGIWTVPIEFPGMIGFVKNHLMPYMISLEESRISHKLLID